jgi:hypothetical protein
MIIGEGFYSMADAGWLQEVSKRFTDFLNPSLERR